MTSDEGQLLCQSYADEAARGVTPSPLTRVILAYEESSELPAEFEVHFDFPAGDADAEAAAKSARDRMIEMVRLDPGLTFLEDFDIMDCAGLVVWNCSDEAAETLASQRPASDFLFGPSTADEDDLDPPTFAEDAELSRQLSMPVGPLRITLPGQPRVIAAHPTRVLTLGLNLALRGWSATVYFDRECSDLEHARYWASKQERLYKENGYRACTSVFYQTPVTPESVVSEVLAVLNAKP